MIASQWAGAFTASGQGRGPSPIPGGAVGVVLLPELPLDNVAGVVVVEELPVLPLPLHDMSVRASIKTKKIEIKGDLECCITTLTPDCPWSLDVI
jgi:hypothetical protein